MLIRGNTFFLLPSSKNDLPSGLDRKVYAWKRISETSQQTCFEWNWVICFGSYKVAPIPTGTRKIGWSALC